jgi:uncharacterized protein YndB with AHSA1/START domain
MKIASTHTYAAPPDVVFRLLTDTDVLVAKYAALGHRDVTIVERTERAGAVAIHSRRGVPMQVPGFARRFLSPVNTVDQHDQWRLAAGDGSRSGTWEASAHGVPVKTGGTLRLTPDGEGNTAVEITAEVSCGVPLLGGRIAAFVGADVERTIHAEEEFNDTRLAQSPKQPATKKPATKAAVRKPAAKQPATRKPAAKKSATKKAATKKAAANSRP